MTIQQRVVKAANDLLEIAETVTDTTEHLTGLGIERKANGVITKGQAAFKKFHAECVEVYVSEYEAKDLTRKTAINVLNEFLGGSPAAIMAGVACNYRLKAPVSRGKGNSRVTFKDIPKGAVKWGRGRSGIVFKNKAGKIVK